jgi:branched-subunit amino acid transport protein
VSELAIAAVIVGLTLVTIATRSSFLVLGSRFRLPERVQHALRYAPAAALTALIAPEIFLDHGALAISITNVQLVSAAVAAVTVLVTRSMFGAIVLGMAVYALMRFAL